jgi:hypothetical protein
MHLSLPGFKYTRHGDLERLPDLSQLTSGEKDLLIGELFATIQALRAQVRELEGS